MSVVRLYTKISLFNIVLLLGVFAFLSYEEGAPAWRILVILAVSQIGSYFAIRAVRKRIAETERERRENGFDTDETTGDRF